MGRKTFSSVFKRVDGHKIPVEIGASVVNFERCTLHSDGG